MIFIKETNLCLKTKDFILHQTFSNGEKYRNLQLRETVKKFGLFFFIYERFRRKKKSDHRAGE
jgi:hypothetical protein